MKPQELKERILDTISDLVVNFTYYDRKEDEELTIYMLEESVENGWITLDEIVEQFKSDLEDAFRDE